MSAAKHLPIVANNERPDVCTPCGGKCCQKSPGFAHPSDFGATREERVDAMARAFATGKWTVEVWQFSDRAVRPAVQGWEGMPEHWLDLPGWYYRGAGPCALHSPTGCALAFDARPAQCRMVVPLGGGRCTSADEHREWRADSEWFEAWEPYHDEIDEAQMRASAMLGTSAEGAGE